MPNFEDGHMFGRKSPGKFTVSPIWCCTPLMRGTGHNIKIGNTETVKANKKTNYTVVNKVSYRKQITRHH